MKRKKAVYTSSSTYLFARPRLIYGFARIIDLGSTFSTYNFNSDSNISDFNALSSDWNMVGVDLKNAINKYKMAINR